MKGTVNKIPAGKNFAFIKVMGEKNDYFFHRDDFSGHWADLISDVNTKGSVEVEFEIGKNAKGPRAMNIKRFQHPNEG